MRLLRACKKIKATYNRTNDYQEQFILLRKRALSQKYAFTTDFLASNSPKNKNTDNLPLAN